MDDSGPRDRFLRVMCSQMWAIQFVFVLNLAIVLLIVFSFFLGSSSPETTVISIFTITLSMIVVLAAVVLSLQCKKYHFEGTDDPSEVEE